MGYLNMDIIIFSIFLLANIVIGLMAGDKVKSLREYAIGNKDFSTGTLTSTIVATWIGGGYMFYALQNIYTSGLQFILLSLGGTLCLLLIGQILAVRMGEFLNNLSVGEAMGKLFGTRVQVVTAISGVLKGIGGIAIQFQVMSKMLTFLFELEGTTATVTAAAIVIFYSAFGGVRSVTITDVFQFIAFSIFIPILGLIVWKQIKDPIQVAHILTTNPIFNFKNVIGWNKQTLSVLFLMLYYAIPGLNPPIFQRISMAKSLTQVKQSFTYAAGFDLLMTLSIAWVAVLLLADNPNLNPKQLVNYIVENYAYTGLKGLVAVGIASMAMSTADSFLNASAVLVVNDVIKPLRGKFNESLLVVRLFSLFLGLLAMGLALRTTDLLKLVLLSSSFWMPIVTVPLLLAIFGFRSSSRAVLIGMAAGFIVVSLGNITKLFAGVDPLIPGMVANLIFYMGSHYTLGEQGGWVGITEKTPLLAARQNRKDAWNKLIYTIRHPEIYLNFKKNIPAYDIIYTLFGIYIMGATYASFYTIPHEIVINYTKLYDAITHSVLFAVAIFITYPGWPPLFKSKKFITIAWPLGIFYVLFVVGTILVIMSGYHEVQVMIFLLNLVIAALLLSWPVMLLLATTGIIVGYWVFSIYCQTMHIHCITSQVPSQFKVIYSILLFSSFLLTLFRFKQKESNLEERNKYLVASYEKCSQELSEVLIYREEVLKDLKEDEIELVDQTAAAYLKQVIYRMVDYLRLEVTKIDLGVLLKEVKEVLKLTDLAHPLQIVIKKNTKENTIQADAEKIKQLLVNSITYIQEHNESNKPIMIILENALLGHRIDELADYTRKLYALKITITRENQLPPTQEIYMLDQVNLISHTNKHPDRNRLIENARIIDAHYGYATFDHHNTHMYVIPINVREVRGKVMELLREPTAADPEEIKHPMAIQLEQELLTKIEPTTNVDIKVIEKALETIKTYHAGVKRKSGEPFFTHPIHVALILLDYCKDQDAVVSALLHDTVEDTSLSLSQVQARFGKTVAIIVEKLTNLEDKRRRLSLDNHEYIARLIQSEDKRIAYVKLADRLHNMRTIQGHSDINKQKKIAEETFQLFVPMAKQLGLVAVAKELEELSLEVLSQKS